MPVRETADARRSLRTQGQPPICQIETPRGTESIRPRRLPGRTGPRNVNVKNHTIPGAIAREQTTLVKNPETLTTGTSNPRKFDRDMMRRLNPTVGYVAATTYNDVLTVIHGPAQCIGRGARKDVERLTRKPANPHTFPSLIEIEFSASPGDVFPAADGLPEDYRQSAIEWALGLSSAVAIAVSCETNGSVLDSR